MAQIATVEARDDFGIWQHTVSRPREKVPTNLVRVMGQTPIVGRRYVSANNQGRADGDLVGETTPSSGRHNTGVITGGPEAERGVDM